jgi:hypothetical protein
MANAKKQQIKFVRILLTVFYGFLLSSTLFRYVIHGIVETVRRPTNPYAIIMIVIGGLLLVSIALSIYAAWYTQLFLSFSFPIVLSSDLFSRFENTTIMLVSGIVLILVFILTLVFGIVRIVKTAPSRLVTSVITTTLATLVNHDDSGTSLNADGDGVTVAKADLYALTEDVSKLIIELLLILFAILATFILYRYVKAKYDPVSTTEGGSK